LRARDLQVDDIASTTLANIAAFERGAPLINEVRVRDVLHPSADGLGPPDS